jgi:hypothetical protein
MHDSGPVTTGPAPGAGFEQTDYHNGPIYAAGVGIVVLALLSYAIAIWLFDRYKVDASEREHRPANAVANTRPRFPADFNRVPGPLLQKDEPAELKAIRDREDRVLSDYGWVDSHKEIVRIPIAEAMRMLSDPEFAKTKGIRAAGPGGAK